MSGLQHLLEVPDGGYTFNASTGKLQTTGYAVGMSKTVPSKTMSAEKFLSDPAAGKKMIVDHLKEARSSGAENVGGWHNPDTGTIMLDQVKVFPNTPKGRTDAIALGQAQGEISIAHLDAITAGDWGNAFISTGGTGNVEQADQRAKLTDHDHQGHPTVRDRADPEEALGDVGLRDRGAGGRPVRGRSEEGARTPEGDQRALIALLDRIESRHKPGGKDHDQSSHAGGRISPVAGQNVNKKGVVTSSIEADLTLSVLGDELAAKCVDRLKQSGGVTPEQAESNMLEMAALAVADAKAKGSDKLDGEDWYDENGEKARQQARDADVHEEVGVAITAALSPGCEWKENSRQAEAVMGAVAKRHESLDTAAIKAINEYADSRKKLPGDPKEGPFTGPKKSEARAGEGETLQSLFEKDPLLAGVALGQAAHAQTAYGYQKFEVAAKLALGGEGHGVAPAEIGNILGGAKVRSFYNNLSQPKSTAGDVTIDVHMMRAMTNVPGSRRENWAGAATTAMTGTPGHDGARLGAMPAMADAVRSATAKFNEDHGTSLKPHQFQAVVWTQQIKLYPPERVKQIASGKEGEVDVDSYVKADGTRVDAYTKEMPT